ncbi:MAG: hypothetical protein HC888_12090 [Candidatus Competibacteraceae bacterium]|nr:hypothetical protein [Candidatus Competibacteraceae bacterium]
MLLIVGAGEVGEAVGKAGLQSGYKVHATTRSQEKATHLEKMGFHPVLLPGTNEEETGETLKELCAKSAIVYSIPPQAKGQDQFWLDLIYGSAAASDQTRVYISSTAVYETSSRDINESTAIDTTNLSPWGKNRLEAENLWRFVGGNIIRVSAFYGPSPDRSMPWWRLRQDARKWAELALISFIWKTLLKWFCKQCGWK